MNIYISLGSVVIALCAFCLTVYQANATRRHNRLSVRPHLCEKAYTDEHPLKGMTYTYEVGNNGIGPARIKSFKIYWKGKLWPRPWGDDFTSLLNELLRNRLNYVFQSSFAFGDESIRSGERQVLLRLFFPDLTRNDRDKILTIMSELKLRIAYESFYGEEFIFRSDPI